jgi:hypothetical protein
MGLFGRGWFVISSPPVARGRGRVSVLFMQVISIGFSSTRAKLFSFHSPLRQIGGASRAGAQPHVIPPSLPRQIMLPTLLRAGRQDQPPESIEAEVTTGRMVCVFHFGRGKKWGQVFFVSSSFFRTNWIVFHHAEGVPGAPSAGGVEEARLGHGEKADDHVGGFFSYGPGRAREGREELALSCPGRRGCVLFRETGESAYLFRPF